MVLDVHELRFGSAVLEGHVLQFAFAAGIADGTIQRMVGQQQFQHRLARLPIFSLSVETIMPSVTGVVQAVCSLGIFSIFTRHMRHAPCSESPG